MTKRENMLKLLQHHQSLSNFNYKIAIDWAIELIQQGELDDSILMLASFSEPIDSIEIKPFVSAALASQGLKEIIIDDAFFIQAYYYLSEIINGYSIRKNLALLRDLCISEDYRKELGTFYLLYYAWDELEDIGLTFYYDNVSLDNIESIVKEQALLWISTYINPAQ